MRDLARTRERGFAIDDQERAEGMRCIAAPVFNAYAEPVAGLSVSGPAFRVGLSDAARIGALVRAAADRVTEVSGRGVGMDVVKRTIAALGGRVEIESAAGRGTTVRVRLPLTLAIMDAMTLRVGDECYVLPLAAVVESLHRDAARLRTIGGRAEVLALRDEVLPVLCLATQFGVAGAAAGPILVIVESEGRRVALRVHELLGQQQVVVKNLETHFMRVDRLSGATILGDGRVALILDVDALVRGAGPAAADAPQLALEPAA